MSAKHIALFGTSADPPTLGHKTILEWLAQRFDLVAVWAADNPFKPQQTPLVHRSNMLELLVASLAASHHNVAFIPELSHPRSWDTVARARQIWGDRVELILTIGSDLVPQLPQWHEVERLLEAVELLVIPRPGHAPSLEHLKRLRALGGRWQIAPLAAPAVSSTAYRQCEDPDAVAPAVRAYIARERLYAECQTSSSP